MEKFKPLEETKIRKIGKLAANPSLAWSEIADRVGVSLKTAKKYGQQARQDANGQNDTQETPTNRVEVVPSQVEDDPEVFEARKRLRLAQLDLETKELQLTSALEDRVTELEDLLSGNDKDGLPKTASGKMVIDMGSAQDEHLENLETRVAALENNIKILIRRVPTLENHLRVIEQRHPWLLDSRL